MKPDPEEPAALLTLLRQQLILAQVRIMELEDLRDLQAPRLAELEQLLGAAQALADRKMDEVAHLEKILAETRGQAELGAAREQRAAAELAQLREALAHDAGLLQQRDTLVAQLQARLAAGEAQLAAMRATRSWRWTAWLRGREADGPQP